MRYRVLGRTGLTVSELGFGVWGIGKDEWVGADDDESLGALRRAIELGVTFIDTANAYGDGHSERLVGRAVRQVGEPVSIASKVPPLNMQYPAREGVRVEEVFPAAWIVERTEESLAHLGVDTLDLQQLHVWSDAWVGQGDWLEAVQRLKAEGKIRAFGVSINVHQPQNAIALVESGQVESVQVIYNIFDQTPADELLPAVEQASVGVIARVPLDEGGLTGSIRPETEFPADDFRSRYFAGERRRAVWERVNAIAAELDVPVDEIAALALRFCLTHPSVSTAIPGMRSVEHVERNVAAIERGPLSDVQIQTLETHRWARNYYASAEAESETR